MNNTWSPKTAKFDEEDIQKNISGTGINGQSEAEDYLDNLLASMNAINADNAKVNQEEQLQHKKEDEEQKENEARIHAEQQRKILQEQYEQEQKEKALREAQEAAEEELLAKEEEKKKQNSMFRRIMGGGVKNENTISETSTPKKQTYDFSDIDKEEKITPIAQENKDISHEKIEEISTNDENDFENIIKDDDIQSLEENITDIKPLKDTNKIKEKKSFFNLFTKSKSPSKSEVKEDDELDFEYLATHDELTGLKNERGYQLDIKNKSVKGTAILFFDVNNLKYINDNLGHQAGNKLLLAASDKLQELFPECGYRIGGDEFIVVLSNIKEKDISKKIEEPIEIFRKYMTQKTKEDEEGIIYSASVGYEIGSIEKTLDEVKEKADKKMYANKKAYKQSHPDYDIRNKTIDKPNNKEEKDYDENLSKEQRALKTQIKTNHQKANVNTTERIMMEIQRRAGEVEAILIASATFDHLFIIQDVNEFIEIMLNNQSIIDYSYLYVIYDGGPQYYGSDEYLSEVTHLFEAIEYKLKNTRNLTDKEILKIKGINVFKNIYIG